MKYYFITLYLISCCNLYSKTKVCFNRTFLKETKLKIIKKESLYKKYNLKSKKNYVIINEFEYKTDSLTFEIINNKFTLIKNLFQNQYSPYPGNISFNIGCPEEYLPINYNFKNDSVYVNALILNANKTYQFGGCISEFKYYKLYYIYYLSSKDKHFYEIRFYSKFDEALDLNKILKNIN